MKNPYSVLNIDVGADQQTIKAAFRKLAKKYHPDVNSGSKEEDQKFIEITEAYNILSDPVSKKSIDDMLNNSSNVKQPDEFNCNFTYDQKYTAQDIGVLIMLFHQEVASYKRQALVALLKGLGWVVLGILVTYSTYSIAAENGGRYVVFYGPIIFGAWQAIKAFYVYFKINAVVKNFEEEMWSKI